MCKSILPKKVSAGASIYRAEGAGSVTAGRAETWRNDYQSIVAPSRRNPCGNGFAGGVSPSIVLGRRASSCWCSSRMGDNGSQSPSTAARAG
jgi:hypothetical protein